MFRVQEVISKYCDVFFKYKVNKITIASSEMDQTEMKAKITTMCKFITALCKFIKVRVNVTLKDSPKVLDMIHKILGRKSITEYRSTLFISDYWVMTFSDEEQMKYQL